MLKSVNFFNLLESYLHNILYSVTFYLPIDVRTGGEESLICCDTFTALNQSDYSFDESNCRTFVSYGRLLLCLNTVMTLADFELIRYY